jgi:hypothetical protein
MSKLASSAFWRDVLDRAVRQGVQVLTPVLLLASAGQIDGVSAASAAIAAGLAAVAVVLKALSGFNTGDPIERAVGAAAGAALAVLPLDFAGVLSLDARAAVTSILGSVLLARAMYVTNPPATASAGAPASGSVDAPDEGDLG